MSLRAIIASILMAALAFGLLLVGGVGSHEVGSLRAGPAGYYPPLSITGVINETVTQENIHSTICTPGWTATIRPASTYTTKLKKLQEQQYNLKNLQGEEEDHYISLELGGDPTDPANLWPESYPTAHLKDQVENLLHRQVCAGTITLQQARHTIIGDWYAVYVSQIQGKAGGVDSADPGDE